MHMPRLLFPVLLLALAGAGCKQSAPDQSPMPEAPKAGAVGKATAVADAANPLASPREEVIAAMHKFMALRSYHAEMHMSSARGETTNRVDFVAPDRMRMDLGEMGVQTVVGDTMYMHIRGRSMKVPMPAGTLTRWRDPGNFKDAEASMAVDAQGVDDVDGVAARKYAMHYTLPRPAEATLWIGPDGLPLQMRVTGEAAGQSSTTTIRYSRYDDPSISVEAPK